MPIPDRTLAVVSYLVSNSFMRCAILVLPELVSDGITPAEAFLPEAMVLDVFSNPPGEAALEMALPPAGNALELNMAAFSALLIIGDVAALLNADSVLAAPDRADPAVAALDRAETPKPAPPIMPPIAPTFCKVLLPVAIPTNPMAELAIETPVASPDNPPAAANPADAMLPIAAAPVAIALPAAAAPAAMDAPIDAAAPAAGGIRSPFLKYKYARHGLPRP